MTDDPDPGSVDDSEDMSDREYMQDDDEMPGEEHSAVLKRLGLTQEEWEDLNN